jgi:glycosyltransferase involved in cell wall biosynthesis
MNVWIVVIYERHPFGDKRISPMRCGMLANKLRDRGHNVVIWTSAFDHISHTHLFRRSVHQTIDDGISIQYIRGCGYRKDQSVKRFFHNRQTGDEFLRLINLRKDSPDIVFACVPTLELAHASVRFGMERNVPVVVDIRDLWPDVYLTMFPKGLCRIAKALLFFEYRRAKYIYKNATGITAISEAYLKNGLYHAQRKRGHYDKIFPIGSNKCTDDNADASLNTDRSFLKKYDLLSGKKFIATFAGTFSKFTDIKTTLDAAELLQDNKDIRIFILGTGDHSERFFEMASRLANVTMTGWLDSRDVRLILQHTTIGLVAYAKNALMSLPNKPFDYLAAGLPLLSSLNGELETIIHENSIGRTYEAGNPASLAKEIRWFYNHPTITKEMRARSKSLFSSQFHSDVVYSGLSEHLENITSKYIKRKISFAN